MSLSSLPSRLAFFSESNPAPCALLLLFSPGNQRGRGFQPPEMSELSPAVNPHTSLSHTETFLPFSSPSLTSILLRLRAIWHRSVGVMTASWTTACHWRLQMPRSCRARTMTPPPRSLRSPMHPAQAWTPIFSASGLTLWRNWAWNGIPQRSRPIAAWINGSCRGIVRPLDNKLHHYFWRSTTRLQSLGVHPTRPTYVSLLPPASLRSMAQKKNVTTACLPWMSQWPRISAHPQPLAGRQKPFTHLSHAGLLQLSLDEPIHRLDRRPQHFTPWRSCKCSRQNSFILWTSRTRTPQLSASCVARPTWLYVPPK